MRHQIDFCCNFLLGVLPVLSYWHARRLFAHLDAGIVDDRDRDLRSALAAGIVSMTFANQPAAHQGAVIIWAGKSSLVQAGWTSP
jgi:hypothetical protein